MRRSIPLLIATLAFASLAHAEDAPEDQSPAAKAYRDAWWAETGGGNLTQALEGYTRASEAEGPASLKARALYKKAVVLQRIGKTEEAIRTLERLAKEYPGEAAPQADARARLAEWTAVDLKTSFAEWYQRYQYSPEFQAKIVDLVLKLGASDQAVGNSVEQEILTIGAPAIPALRQQIGSANATLRFRAVMSLLLLGEVPSMEALRATSTWGPGWQSQPACWATLRSASAEVRARLRAEAKADQAFDQGLVAAFDGPAALLAWAATPEAKGLSEVFLSRAFWWDQKQPEPAAMRPLLLAIVQDTNLSKPARSQVAYWLFSAKLVDAALAEAWVGGDDPLLRERGLSFLAATQGAPADAPAALRRLLKAAPSWRNDDQQGTLAAAVLAGLDATPTGDELDRLADELLPLGQWHHIRFPLSAAARVVLARLVDRARDPHVAVSLIQLWQRPGGGAEGDVDRLAGWVRSAPYEGVRQYAVQALTRVPSDGPKRALAILAEPDLPPDIRFMVFDYLAQDNGSAGLLGEPTSRRALLALVRAQEQVDPPRAKQYAARLLEVLSRSGIETRRATFLEWVADPAAFPRSLLRFETGQVSNVGALITALEPMGPAWRSAWPTWTPAQRDAALESLGALVYMQDPELKPFRRTIVLDASNGISKASRESLLRHLDQLTLDDLRAVYDLTTPKGTDDAVLLAFRKGPQNPPESTPELFEALKLGLRPDGNDWIARALFKAFQHEPKVQRPLVEALLAHQVDSVQESAIEILAARESTDDLALWLKALALPAVDVRARAAAGLGRIAHPDATKALVAALDDPNSRVRDAAIASLEAIQKVEDLKKTWREKTEGRR